MGGGMGKCEFFRSENYCAFARGKIGASEMIRLLVVGRGKKMVAVRVMVTNLGFKFVSDFRCDLYVLFL